MLRPVSADELAAAVKSAAEQGKKLKAVGSGHSFTGCSVPQQVMIRLDGLSSIINADKESGRVTVGAGTGLRKLNAGPGGVRPGDGEPRRHRQADHLRRDLHRHARHRRAARRPRHPGRRARPGHRGRLGAALLRGGEPGRLRGGPGLGRRARRDQLADPAVRAGVPAARAGDAAAARRGAGRVR